jgi:hypothetical protein
VDVQIDEHEGAYFDTPRPRDDTPRVTFTGVKVFSATKAKEREELGETITRWLRANPELEIVDRVVSQSSDDEFHCLSVVLFYRQKA